MPGVRTVNYLEKLCGKYSHPSLYVVILTSEDNAAFAKQAIKYGARAYISKSVSMSDLKKIVRRVVENDEVIINVNGNKEDGTMPLTKEEIEVIRLLVKGSTNKEMAQKVHRTEAAIEARKRSIRNKLASEGVSNDASLGYWACKNNLMED